VITNATGRLREHAVRNFIRTSGEGLYSEISPSATRNLVAQLGPRRAVLAFPAAQVPDGPSLGSNRAADALFSENVALQVYVHLWSSGGEDCANAVIRVVAQTCCPAIPGRAIQFCNTEQRTRTSTASLAPRLRKSGSNSTSHFHPPIALHERGITDSKESQSGHPLNGGAIGAV
jgi:hypothetical protein